MRLVSSVLLPLILIATPAAAFMAERPATSGMLELVDDDKGKHKGKHKHHKHDHDRDDDRHGHYRHDGYRDYRHDGYRGDRHHRAEYRHNYHPQTTHRSYYTDRGNTVVRDHRPGRDYCYYQGRYGQGWPC